MIYKEGLKYQPEYEANWLDKWRGNPWRKTLTHANVEELNEILMEGLHYSNSMHLFMYGSTFEKNLYRTNLTNFLEWYKKNKYPKEYKITPEQLAKLPELEFDSFGLE